MKIVRLKAKNQLTIPTIIVSLMKLKKNELFRVDVEENYIKLTPVEVEPRYSPEELASIDRVVKQEKGKAKRTLRGPARKGPRRLTQTGKDYG